MQDMGEICPTLQTEGIPSRIEPWEWEIDGERYRIRIRKLTPKECFRLQAFGYLNEDGTWNDECFNKAEEVNSNTQLYKQAGNSITVEVIRRLIGNLFEVRDDD